MDPYRTGPVRRPTKLKGNIIRAIPMRGFADGARHLSHDRGMTMSARAHARPEDLIGPGQDGGQDSARRGACLWRRAFHGLGECLLGRLYGGVLFPVDCRRVAEQGHAAAIGDVFWGCGSHHSHCPVPAESLAVPDRHEHLYRLLHLYDVWYFPMVFLVRRRVSVPLLALAGGSNPLNDFQTVLLR